MLKRRLLLLRVGLEQVKRRCSSTSAATAPPKRHLIFFGSDSFSIGVFRELLTQYRPQLTGIEACVVSRQVLFAKYLATYYPDINVHVWPQLPQIRPEETHKIALVASFGKLIPENFISSLPNRILNIHPSLLPRWRGAAPLPRCIMAGDLVVGVTVCQVAPRHFDVGRVFVQQEVVPNSEMKIDQLSNTLATTGVRLLVDHVLSDLEGSVSKTIDQNSLPYRPIVAKRLKHTDLNVEWSQLMATQIVRLFAATLATDHHHKNVTGQLRTSFDGNAIRLIQMDLMPVLDSVLPEEVKTPKIAIKPGRIVFDQKNRDRLLVATQRGWVAVRRLIFKKPMSASDFYNGYLSKRPESAHFFE